jgi:hypothetical protein
MRYVCKIHVLDVMTKVVVSGYIHGYAHMGVEPPITHEFSYTIPGVGLSDPYEWLTKALYEAVLQMTQDGRQGRDGRPGDGVPHTISETSDTGKTRLG